MRKFAVAAVAALMSTSAIAADKGQPVDLLPPLPAAASSASCYVQGMGGSKVSTVKETETDTLPAIVSATGWTISGGIGCDLKFERIVIGAGARVDLPIETDGSIVGDDPEWMAFGRLGYLVTGNTLVYGMLGYTQSDFKIDLTNVTKDGIVIGAGLEVGISELWSLVGEWNYLDYGKSTNLAGVQSEPEGHVFRFGATRRFSGLFGE